MTKLKFGDPRITLHPLADWSKTEVFLENRVAGHYRTRKNSVRDCEETIGYSPFASALNCRVVSFSREEVVEWIVAQFQEREEMRSIYQRAFP